MSGRPSARTAASSPATKSKSFKPRAGIVRKSKAERDEYAKQEAERAAARAVAAASANTDETKSSQSKQAERKTRDNKQKEGPKPEAPGSGVFGAGTGNRPAHGRKIQDAGSAEMLEGQEGLQMQELLEANAEPSTSGREAGLGSSNLSGATGETRHTRNVVEEYGYEIEPETEDDNEPKRDIERIWISSGDEASERSDEDEVVTSKGKNQARVKAAKAARAGLGLRPVRAARSDAELEERGGFDHRNDTRQLKSYCFRHEGSEHVYNEDNDIQLDEDSDTLQAPTKQDARSSPELSKKKMSRKLMPKSKDAGTSIETAEEQAERLRFHDDVRKMREEFIFLPKFHGSAEDKDMVDTDPADKLEGRLLLLQFPPIVPYLVDTDMVPTQRPPTVNIKADPDAPSEAPRGEDPGNSGSSASKVPKESILTAVEPLRLPSGRVGKLRVHKSGKVSLDWGGIDMEIRHGTDVDFLQDAVFVEPMQGSDLIAGSSDEHLKKAGTAYALGQVQRKLIAIPDWQKLYD